MPHRDDAPVGQLLSRRQVLAALGAAGAALLVPSTRARAAGRLVRARPALPACIARPAQTEGPYYVDTRLERSDIRSDPSDGSVAVGVPLALVFRVSRLDGVACAPLAGALVDVWQCDAVGVYSGVKDRQGRYDTVGRQFLRGHQRTGRDGVASFRTIYPGWYGQRTAHVHFKIRTDPEGARGTEFTSQLYFDDVLSDAVFAAAPYNTNTAPRLRNGDDRFFAQGGRELTLAAERAGDGFRGTFDVGLVLG